MPIRAARYEENMRYAITLLNVEITILLAINIQKSVLSSAAFTIMVLKHNTVLVEFEKNARKLFPTYFY